MNTTRLKKLGALCAFAVAGAAQAAATEATSAITSAQTDALSVAAALLGMGAAIWGAMFIYKKFFGGR